MQYLKTESLKQNIIKFVGRCYKKGISLLNKFKVDSSQVATVKSVRTVSYELGINLRDLTPKYQIQSKCKKL
jgi:hypothetical protein